jgi:hypothetical protein
MDSETEFDRRAVETWFRRRGLPFMVRSGKRGTRLLQRSVPALVFLLALDPLLSFLTFLIDVPDAEFTRRANNTAYVFALLALIVAALVVPVLLGFFASRVVMPRIGTGGRWVAAITVLVLNLAVLPIVDWSAGLRSDLAVSLAISGGSTLLVLLAVYAGLGSIASWGLRKALTELGAVGRMATKALPLLVLVVIFAFFSTEMWQIASALQRWRLWLVVALFAVLGVLFMVARLDEELRKMIDKVSTDRIDDLAGVLRGTPLERFVDGAPIEPRRLSRGERANISLVLFLAQLLQIVVLTVLVFCVLIVLGALAIDWTVIDSWLGEGASEKAGTLFGIKLPLSHALVQVSLFLSVFSGLYFTASAATDQHYRESFFDPLLDDVRVSLAARQVYLARRDGAP